MVLWNNVTNVKLDRIRYYAVFFDGFLCTISCKSLCFILSAQFSAPVFVETATLSRCAEFAVGSQIFKKNVKKLLISEFLSLCRMKLLVYYTEISYFHNIYRFRCLSGHKNTGQSERSCPVKLSKKWLYHLHFDRLRRGVICSSFSKYLHASNSLCTLHPEFPWTGCTHRR